MSHKNKRGQYNKQAKGFFDDIRLITTESIQKALDIDKDIAEQIAFEITNRLSQHWGGSMFYVTKNSPWQIHERDKAIWREFNGHNHNDLATKFKLCVPWIYDIIARMRLHHATEKQKDLFDDFE